MSTKLCNLDINLEYSDLEFCNPIVRTGDGTIIIIYSRLHTVMSWFYCYRVMDCVRIFDPQRRERLGNLMSVVVEKEDIDVTAPMCSITIHHGVVLVS